MSAFAKPLTQNFTLTRLTISIGLDGAAVQISEEAFETHGVEALVTTHNSSSEAGEAAATEQAKVFRNKQNAANTAPSLTALAPGCCYLSGCRRRVLQCCFYPNNKHYRHDAEHTLSKVLAKFG